MDALGRHRECSMTFYQWPIIALLIVISMTSCGNGRNINDAYSETDFVLLKWLAGQRVHVPLTNSHVVMLFCNTRKLGSFAVALYDINGGICHGINEKGLQEAINHIKNSDIQIISVYLERKVVEKVQVSNPPTYYMRSYSPNDFRDKRGWQVAIEKTPQLFTELLRICAIKHIEIRFIVPTQAPWEEGTE